MLDSPPLRETVTVDAAPARIADAGAVEWLIDNECAYETMLRSIRSARRSIWITQLAFDADCVAHASQPAGRLDGPAGGATVLSEALLAAVDAAPIDVRVLVNATLLLDTAGPLEQFFRSRMSAGRSPLGTIEVRGTGRFPQLLHAKMIIADGEAAILMGSPFANGYWDDTRHLPVDARRPARELGGRPLHDVSLRVEGAPVAELELLFDDLWTQASTQPDAPRPELGIRSAPGHDRHDDPLRIVCTSPPRMLRGAPEGATEIMDALLEGIAGARTLIYIEHQYLSARPVIRALSDALHREPNLELVVVLNQNPDVTAYRGWQNARLRESGWLDHPRVGLFTPWSAYHDATGGRPTLLNQVFVHSKVLAIDDRWATVGSANLDGVSLHSYGDDFTGRFARRVFRDVRNFDVNVVVSDPSFDPTTPSGPVRELRTRLWSEHLGLDTSRLEARPREGWLSLWRRSAARNLSWLRGDGQEPSVGPPAGGFVVPYSTQPTPARQLAALGVSVDPDRLELCFDPGWLEVHFSPNWVRNVFA